MNIKEEIQTFAKVMINTKKWKYGQKIPSESSLSKQFFCSRLTVRNAYQNLVEQNVLRSVQGDGYYVNVDYESLLSTNVVKTNISFGHDTYEKNKKMFNHFNHLKIMKYNEINTYNTYKKIYFDEDEKPYQYIKGFVNPGIFKKLDKKLMNESISLSYLEQNVIMNHRKRVIVARKLTNEEQNDFSNFSAESFIVTYCVLMDKNNKLIEYSITYTKPEKTKIYCDQELH